MISYGVKILNQLVEFQKNNPNVYIGGSVALLLQDAIPFRIPKDIDVITPNKIHIHDIFKVESNKHPRIRSYKYNDLKWELFYNPEAKYTEYIYIGNIIKLSPVDEIMSWKYRFQKHAPDNIKNNTDIEYYETN
jgi:tRNA U38,U39,U40 pseudouridine synthase TruA